MIGVVLKRKIRMEKYEFAEFKTFDQFLNNYLETFQEKDREGNYKMLIIYAHNLKFDIAEIYSHMGYLKYFRLSHRNGRLYSISFTNKKGSKIMF